MKKLLTATALAGGVLCVSKGLDKSLEVSEYTISSDKIPPEFNGFKIIHLSDAHSEIVPGMINRIKSESPDLIVCTGDMTDDDKRSFSPTLYLMKKMRELAPVYMVTGNHDLARPDFSQLEKALTAEDAHFLHNRRIIIKRGASEIALTGISDPATMSASETSRKIAASLSNIDRYNGYEILLFHRANFFESLAGNGFDLVLAGHMHGGQVRIPGLGGLAGPRSSALCSNILLPKYFAGRYTYKEMTMIVSRGLGNPMLLPRLFNRPEVISITLKNKICE